MTFPLRRSAAVLVLVCAVIVLDIKDLPAGRNPVQLNGFGDAVEAKALITESLQRFEKKTP